MSDNGEYKRLRFDGLPEYGYETLIGLRHSRGPKMMQWRSRPINDKVVNTTRTGGRPANLTHYKVSGRIPEINLMANGNVRFTFSSNGRAWPRRARDQSPNP